MTENQDPLDLLLSAAAKELEEPVKKQNILKETDLFSQPTNLLKSPLASTTKDSLLHTRNTDSSDDEDRRNWEENKYSESGREIKRLLESPNKSSLTRTRISRVSEWKKPLVKSSSSLVINKNSSSASKSSTSSVKTQIKTKNDAYIDPCFGLRIVNPLISFDVLKDKMTGREAIYFCGLKRFLQIKTKDSDWVLAGVIVNKSTPKTSQKGSQFSVWTLSDLKDDIKTVAIFLFSGAHQQLWKTSVGTIVGLLNPNVLDKRDGKDEASLSIDNAQKVMVFGQSKDFGTCKSVKKNGDKCNAIVNLAKCEYCVYHIKQEYQKCTIRSDLQSSFAGRGLTALRNKVLGKNEVFYAGKSYTAIPAKTSRKLEMNDRARLNNLKTTHSTQAKSSNQSTSKKMCGVAPKLDYSHAQKIKDLKLMEKLNGTKDVSDNINFEGKQSSDVTIADAKCLANSVLSKLKSKTEALKKTSVEANSLIAPEMALNKDRGVQELSGAATSGLLGNRLNGTLTGFPKLSGSDTGSVDLSILSRTAKKAKLDAIRLIQKKGPIKKADPNNIRGSGIKRPINVGDDELENDAKKIKADDSFTSSRFKKMMGINSKHLDLLEARDNEEKDKYFHKLEVKEKMEDKMVGTQKIACKAVKCLQCKYVSFSASDLCKSEKHPLKVFDAVKRFFKCGNCQNRIACLEVVPLKACNNCNSSNWQKTGMMKEKLVTAAHSLSIRGGEQKFTNAVITDSNLNLLVPD